MKTQFKIELGISLALLTAFVLWTIAVCFFDVQPIGPQQSAVGFAAFNRAAHELTGTNTTLYILTDWLGLVPFGVCIGFGILGLWQWIRRKSLRRVDTDLLVLGGFYLITVAVYLLFEAVVINYRPVLIDGVLEASYPSSTTLLVLCVMPTAAMQLHHRLTRPWLRRLAVAVITVFTVFMVVGRWLSGVHWTSDILGGALFSAGLVTMYHAITRHALSRNTQTRFLP